jgi:hypothetical protein
MRKQSMSDQHEYSTRLEAFLARDVAGVPLALILCALAALGLGLAAASTLT